jgi:uncharacterized protein
MTGDAAVRVVIADDQRVVRDGLVVLVELCEGIEVVGAAPDGAAAVALVAELAPDIVLMDLRMPELDGVAATREIAGHGPTRVIVLTTYADDESIFPALRAGAAGYLTKDASAEEIEAAIRAVHRGQTWLDPVVQARLVSALGPEVPGEPARTERPPDSLTPREAEVLGLIGEGLSNQEIGERLVLGQATVKTHVNRIFAKIGVRTRAQAVRYAISNGLAGSGNRHGQSLLSRSGSRQHVPPGGTMTVQDVSPAQFAAEWESWHKEHTGRLAAPDGFLAITSINWLTETPTRFADAPGEWTATADGVTVVLGDGEELTLDGATIRGRHHFGQVPERGGVFPSDGTSVYEVARRGGNDILRPRHPGNALRASFRGTPAYAPDPRWAIRGRYRAFEAPRDTTVGSVVEGLQHVYAAPGVVEFEVSGQPHALTAFNGAAPGSLHILFTDATSGVTTYSANRSLRVAAPGADGSVLLDFNRATNLPCAYTEFATCPLPPAGNRLPFAVEAGEQIPYEATA